MSQSLDLTSPRARKARLAAKLGKNSDKIGLLVAAIALCGSAVLWLVGQHGAAFFGGSLTIALYMPAIWYRRDLRLVPPDGPGLTDRMSVDALKLLRPGRELTPQTIWHDLSGHWQVIFICNHLVLSPQMLEEAMSTDLSVTADIWLKAIELADTYNSLSIEPGYIAAACLLSSPSALKLLSSFTLTADDIINISNWLGNGLREERYGKQRFGGIARDWSFGYTPLLDQFGESYSQGIMRYGAQFGDTAESAGVKSVESAFAERAAAIALVGETGSGKTTLVMALAQRLIEGKTVPELAYHQIISLDAAAILSAAQRPGELEQIVISLVNEASHAGHIILFLDDASLFFGDGPGSFDATRILRPIIEGRAVRLILAMTPNEYQRLKSQNSGFASLLTPVVLTEPNEQQTMPILMRSATRLENRHKVIIAYEAIREAYRLSGRYDQETAYPGKAIKLLEQSIPLAESGLILARTIQATIEQTRGVKVGSAAPAEADTLLHLEDRIHERMVNQTYAVKVVSSALRRARAGVADPRRPIGSFLFLGPTGVGKTELAKAIAATYFGAESNMVRLDMSEYQQPEDVKRLLSNGENETKSLILSIRKQPFTVVLLDEIEKAHPNILNLLLQLLDEGQLTDSAGRGASFKDSIIIATSNAGANTIRERVGRGEKLESFEEQFTDELINSGQFKPELLNRFDEIVLFRPLEPKELGQVVQLMMGDVNRTLSNQNISVELTAAAVTKIVEAGYDARLGARPMRRMLQRAVEDAIAGRILRGETKPGDHLTLDVTDLTL